MKAWIAIQWRVVQVQRLLSLTLFLAGFSLVACAGESVNGDTTRGRQLFTSLPCSGCHGALAQGGFGPALAGTNLTFAEVQRQVRTPRDQMPEFARSEVSERDLHDIYAWLTSLPAATPTAQVTLRPPEATAAARARFYPAFDATSIVAQMDNLDEVALRLQGQVTAVEEKGRFTEVRVKMSQDQVTVTVLALYDTGLSRRSFPAALGDRVTLYGVGTEPVEINTPEGLAQKIPRIQVLEVVVH